VTDPEEIYTDGGVIGQSPSLIGGTWAFCWVSGGKRVREESGVVQPWDMKVDKVTNNLTELIAAVQALSSVPKRWGGTLYTDSSVTLARITDGESFRGVPYWLRSQVLDLRRVRHYRVCLVGGHPTRLEIERGTLRRNGLPASEHNVWCDKACTAQAMLHKELELGTGNRV